MRAVWHEANVMGIEIVSESKMLFSMKCNASDAFHFDAGQFITMDLPLGEKRRQRWRSYSIANIPNDDNVLEFGIGHLDDGLASQYFFTELKVGDTIKFKGPEGAFILPTDLDREIVMIATGTGVVPFVSMIRKIVNDQLNFKSIRLIYGSRYEKDILYRKELEQYNSDFKNFHVDFVLSKAENWNGAIGHVHDVYNKIYSKKRDDILYLLCGWTSMVDEAMVHLFPKVVTPLKQIKYELYG